MHLHKLCNFVSFPFYIISIRRGQSNLSGIQGKITKITHGHGSNKVKISNFKAFFPCLKELSDCCYDYINLHTLVNLQLVMNIGMQCLFALCAAYH